MTATADGRFAPAPSPREVWLTFGLSVLLHALLTVALVMIPRFQVGSYITVPVSYTVNLVSAPPGGPGGGRPAAVPAERPAPAVLRPPAPAPAPAERPAPAVRPAPRPAPPAAPTEELTLPGRRPAAKPAPGREPSLRPPTPAAREAARPTPAPSPAPAAVAPPVPQAAPPVASARPGAGAAAGKESGVELAGTASGAGGGTALAAYLTLVDWKIQQNWVPLGAPASPEAVAVVRFRVLRSGEVRGIELESSSGSASLDTSALRAVRQSLPLPPFSNLLTEPWLDLRYRFVMERG